VVPYVEDYKNCLLIEPRMTLSRAQRLSLQEALRQAIQLEFQLEDRELGVESLPDSVNPERTLIYEASEGGAGVLRRLVGSAKAWSAVVHRALEVCHFDPMTGDDLGGPGNDLECEAACYDCLLSYTNQQLHLDLDRKSIRDLLLHLRDSHLAASPTQATRAEHLDRLRRLCDSDLERRWLDLLETHDLNLPDTAQMLIPECDTRADFLYEGSKTAVYVDGPHHDDPHTREEDRRKTDALEDRGYTVLRFRHDQQVTWPNQLSRLPSIFGKLNWP
jgi:very-short-patch-repair endonuclease